MMKNLRQTLIILSALLSACPIWALEQQYLSYQEINWRP